MKSKASKKDEAASMEAQGSNRIKKPTIHFDSKDKDSMVSRERESVGEVMEVVASITLKAVHPITLITFLMKYTGRITYRALLDQCCMDKGLISCDLANSLGLFGVEYQSTSFFTAAGTFCNELHHPNS